MIEQTSLEIKLLTEIEKAELQEIANGVGSVYSENMRNVLLSIDLLLQENQKLKERLKGVGVEQYYSLKYQHGQLTNKFNQAIEVLHNTISDIDYQVHHSDPHPALLGIVATVNTFKQVLTSLREYKP